MEEILGWLQPLVEAYAGKFGIVLQIVSIVGTLRLLVKPLMEALKAFVLITPSKKDDELPGKIEGSKLYKSAMFVLDWLASLKFKS